MFKELRNPQFPNKGDPTMLALSNSYRKYCNRADFVFSLEIIYFPSYEIEKKFTKCLCVEEEVMEKPDD